MPVGTVRGRFELDAPALKTLRELERQGVRTEAQMKKLGEEMDRVGGQDDAQHLRDYGAQLGETRRTSERLHREMRADWRETTRVVRTEVRRQAKELDYLNLKLDALGQKNVSPTIDVTGFAEANVQLSELERRLDAFDRKRYTATAGVRRSALPAGVGGGGGSGAGSAFGGGGGGRGRRGGGLLDFGMRGIKPRNLLIGAGVLYGRSLIGSAGALVGSAGSAFGGAGALGATGLGGALIGGGLGMATEKTLQKPIQEVYKDQVAFTQAVALHGRASTQAAAAQDKLNVALSHAPEGTQRFLRELNQVRDAWRQGIAPGQRSLLTGAGGFLGGVRGGIRGRGGFAGSANIADAAIGQSATRFGRFLGSGAGQQGVRTGANIFAENLPTVERDLEHIYRLWTNIARATRPFFREFNDDLERTLGKWERGTRDIEATRGHVRTMTDDLKTWGRLLRSSANLLIDLGKAGRGEGSGLVEDLTRQIDRWDTAVNRNPAQTRQWFRETVDSTKRLAGALAGIVKSLEGILRAAGPTLNALSDLASLASGIGLLGSPGSLAAVAGGYAALRGRGGGGGGGLRGLLPVGGGGARGGGGLLAAAPAVGVGALGGGGMGRAGRATYGQQFRPGAPVSQLGDRGTGLGRLFGGGGRFARGGTIAAGVAGAGARAYLPIGALFALAQGSAFDGSAGGKIQSGLSQFTFGAIPNPQSRAEARDRGAQIAAGVLGAGPDTSSRSALHRQTSGLEARLAEAIAARGRGGANTPLVRTNVGPIDALQNAAGGGGDPTYRFRGKQMSQHELDSYIGTLRKELGVRQQLVATTDQEAAAELRRQRRAKADKAFRDIGNAYDLMLKKFGKDRALRDFSSNLETEIAKAGPAGRKRLARDGAQWVKQMRDTGQLTAAEAKKANTAIIEDFQRLGRRIRIANGNIHDGSRQDWKQISDAIGTYAEQARQRAHDAFTGLQRDAIASLNAMGISGASARHIVQLTDADSSKSDKRAGKFAARNARDPLSPGGYGQRRRVTRQTGGRIPGIGEHDTVPVGPSATAAPGELIVNKHTERRINQFLGGHTTLGREVQKEQRGHSSQLRQMAGLAGIGGGMFATGGRGQQLGVHQGTGNLRSSASLSGVHPGVLKAARAIESRFPGLIITSGTGGGHVSGSYHYKGEAVDIAGGQAEMDRAAAWINRSGLYRSLTEGIHNPNLSVKYGKHVPSSYYAGVWAGHRNHIHIAVAGSGAGIGGARGALGGGYGDPGNISLRARRSGLRGVPGALADASIAAQTRGMERMVNRRLGHRGGGGLGGFHGGGSPGANERLGHRMMLAAGWPESEWPALRQLWTRESGWNQNARNPSSGAYGIPQALGHGHVFGSNPADQIRWGLRYIKGRYGSPSGAWGHEQSAGWYATGGRVGGGLAYVGDSLGVGTAPFIHPSQQNVKVGRSSASGVQALAGMSGYGKLIFDLGTNDGSASQLASSLRRADRISGDAQMYVPYVHGPGAAAKNAVIRRMAGGDIHPVQMGRQGLGPDGIHYSAAGYRQRAARFAGAFRGGASFMTRGATSFVAGEGGRDEHVQVTPMRPKRRPAGAPAWSAGRGSAALGGVHLHFEGGVHVRSDEDIDKIADAVGERLVKYLADDDSKDEALIGG